jgi:hypothetical protein
MHNYMIIFHQLFVGFPRFMVDWLYQKHNVPTKVQCSTTSIHDNKIGISLKGSLTDQALGFLLNGHEFELFLGN